MSQLDQLVVLANYNKLMNERQYEAASKLSKEDLVADKGAFFKSVLGTLNHILVGDIIWLKRFVTHPSSSSLLAYIDQLEKPVSLDAVPYQDFNELSAERVKVDQVIVDWMQGLSEQDLDECLSYSNMAGNSFCKPFGSLINHLFLHQVHHRGQVTTLLSQFGVDFGETDLIEIIADCDGLAP